MLIGEMIRMWRALENIGVREAAKDFGISSATLSRIENGHDCNSTVMRKLIGKLFS